MSDYYILDGKIPVKCGDINEWGKWFERKPGEEGTKRIVARTEQGDVSVSTVFIGIDHRFGVDPDIPEDQLNDEDAPVIFETMIFGGEHDDYQVRYHTWEQAEAGHKRACVLAGITGEK